MMAAADPHLEKAHASLSTHDAIIEDLAAHQRSG
jgi:hypothetical protein